MLQHISWQQYFTGVTILTALWYAFVSFRYYRPEITDRFRTAPIRPPLVAASPLGAIKTDNETTDSEALLFGPPSPDDLSDTTGPTNELVAEAQILAKAFLDTPDKTEFLSLLGVLLSKYESYGDEIDLKALRPLAKQLPFSIEENEWPTFKN